MTKNKSKNKIILTFNILGNEKILFTKVLYICSFIYHVKKFLKNILSYNVIYFLTILL